MGCVMENKKWIKNTLKAFVNVVIFVFLAVALVSVSVTVFSSKDADGTAEIFGYQIRLVKSPSMEACAETNVSKYEIKSIPVNSMVLIETVPKTASEANEWYAALKVGDVLTFKYLYAEHVVITHRMHHNTRHTAIFNADIAYVSSALFRALDLHAEIRSPKIAIPNKDILNAARHFASHGNAVSLVATAIKHA